VKKAGFTIFFCLIFLAANAQEKLGLPPASSTQNVNKQQIKVRSWQIDERYGIADTCGVDTVITSFQDNIPVHNYSIANSWSGNLGSPLQSKIFFDRTSKTNFIFSNPYDAYTVNASDIRFFNTKTPYALLTYRTALPKFEEEDYFRAIFSMNINKYLNVGGLVNFISGRGQLQKQTSRMTNGGFFASYSGKRYACNAVFMVNDFRNLENGGIAETHDSAKIFNKSYRYSDLDVKLNSAISYYRSFIYFYNHKYSLGSYKERKLANDSVVLDFVPVTSFIHTIKFEDAQKKYVETEPEDFYSIYNYSTGYTKDSTKFRSLKNTFAVTLEEKFNRILKFGLAAFVEHEFIYRTVSSDWLRFVSYYENDLSVGGMLSKNEGKTIKYNASGQVVVVGRRLGDFDVKGNIATAFRVLKDTLSLSAGVFFGANKQDFLMENYYSNHFNWKNNFDKTLNLKIKARISLQKTGISIGFNMANITNFVYFDENALPAQHNGNVQVMAFDATANLKFWKFHWDNKLVYQISSNREVLPLPDFAFYTNLYFKTRVFKVLIVQLGMSCRYNTAYYAPRYMPATGQFYLQNEEKIGNYPQMNVYLNLHLKRARIYFQYSNWNKDVFGGRNYFLMPNYPMNPGTFQMGVAWAFYN